MDTERPEIDESVAVSLELTGKYDSVIEKLRTTRSKGDDLSPVVTDLSAIRETVVRLDGGTRSVIADGLPEDTAVSYDSEAVVDALQVLKRYGLVVLDGNTWKPGPDGGG